MNQSVNQAVSDYLNAHRSEIVGDLKALAAIPSVLGNGGTTQEAPFGAECRRALEASAALFAQNGFAVKIDHQAGYAACTLGEAKNTIGLFSHGDVVPVNASDWLLTRPFDPVEAGNCLVGRGVKDDKCGVVASLYAVKAIRELGLPFHSSVMCFIGSNEETGMTDIKTFAQNEPMPTVSFVPDSDFPFSIGEKGILHFHVVSHQPLTQLTLEAGTAMNILPGQAMAQTDAQSALGRELSARSAAEGVRVAADGNRLTVQASGISKHAAMPDGGESAIKKLTDYLLSCTALCDGDRRILQAVSDSQRDFYGTALNIDAVHEHQGKLTCVMGTAHTDELGFVTLGFDIRYVAGITGQTIQERCERFFADRGFTVAGCEDNPGFAMDPHSPLIASLQETYRTVTGLSDKAFTSGGGTYARYLRNALSTGVEVPGYDKGVTLAAGHGDLHQSDEAISIDGFLHAIRVLIAYLLTADTVLNA